MTLKIQRFSITVDYVYDDDPKRNPEEVDAEGNCWDNKPLNIFTKEFKQVLQYGSEAWDYIASEAHSGNFDCDKVEYLDAVVEDGFVRAKEK